MALPLGTDVEYLGANASGGMCVGLSASELVSFHGVTPVAQAATQAASSVVSVATLSAAVWGFSCSAAFYSTVQLVSAMRTAMIDKGLMASA